jgi:uncharacterized membrane protein YhaH (DUF805 family)
MTYSQSITTCLKKYVDFSGRASRSEYWYFAITAWAIEIALRYGGPLALSSLVSLALVLPLLSAGVRRMHDTNRSGWWILLPIVNLVFMLQGTREPSGPRSGASIFCPHGHQIQSADQFCPTCGVDTSRRCANDHVLGPDTVFCPTCGEGVPRRCPNGHPVSASDDFCTTCGARVGPA